jgi:putative oxidoreductase
MPEFVSLRSLQRFGDFTLLLFRLFVGLFLVWGVWDNVTSAERMHEFAGFLAKSGFWKPAVLAPVSVYAQLLAGVLIAVGLFTRWAGILCAVNFIVAIAMVDYHAGLRGTFPSGCLVAFGLFLATHGAGKLSVDQLTGANDTPKKAGGVRFKA